MKILLVEDNIGDARFVMEILKDAKPGQYELKHVERFHDAIDELKKESYHVILLDLLLPDSRGVATFSRMHSLFPDIPIIVLTGYEDETVAFDALQEGIEVYLIKSKVDAKHLKQAMEYAVKKSKSVEQNRNKNTDSSQEV